LVPATSAMTSALKLSCKCIDDGLLKISGLPGAVQDELLAAVFPAGTRGVCGGLYDARSGVIDAGNGEVMSVAGSKEVTMSELGLHGSHIIEWELAGSAAGKVLGAAQQAAKDVLEGFSPDCIRVAFENMRGRRIRRGQTLCGWARESDRVDNSDGSPKILVLLGSAKISRGFKYAKEDKESLDVELSPGDMLVLYGPARSWVSAVNGFQPGDGDPFDFVHVWLQDHRRLKQRKPEIYEKIHSPPAPSPAAFDYKWMQFSYLVLEKPSPGGWALVELQGDQESSQATSSEAGYKGNSKGRRRWTSKTEPENRESKWARAIGA